MKSKMGAVIRSFENPPQSALRSSFGFGQKALIGGAIMLALGMTTDAFAKGGTAKPPVPNAATPLPAVFPAPIPLQARTDANTAAGSVGLNGFDVTGFMQGATVATNNAMCTPNPDVPGQVRAPSQDPLRAGAGLPNLMGGTVKINGVTINIPCNTIVQMPANTLTWADFVSQALPAELDAAGNIIGYATKGLLQSPQHYEVRVVGNTVGTTNIAALVYVSQQSLNAGSGVISRIDYAKGRIEVANGLAAGITVLEINDPNARFGMQHLPDPRFSVDDQNPTIHSGTGYPMCVPRTDPAVADDPNCPQINRPTPAQGCRTFTLSGMVTLPRSGELPPPIGGVDRFCKSFVMPAVSTAVKGAGGVVGVVVQSVNPLPGQVNPAAGTVFVRTANQPDASKQAPLEVGDFISWSGTLFDDGTGTGTDYVSVHTIEANVGIHTQPGTQPAYIAIGGFGLGPVDPPGAGAAPPVNFNGVAAEATNRLFLEASTTDVITPVDIYYMDSQADGSIQNRWVTPFAMTGECDPAPAVAPVGGVLGGTCLGIQGGITTQLNGPQNMRARIRAIKPPNLLLNKPGRYVRVVQRSLCKPAQPVGGIYQPADQLKLDTCINNAAVTPGAGATLVANGLRAGQYLAPVFEYIFPENTQAGQPIIPNDFWDLPFLVNGEGPYTGPSVGPLQPVPW